MSVLGYRKFFEFIRILKLKHAGSGQSLVWTETPMTFRLPVTKQNFINLAVVDYYETLGQRNAR